MTQVGNFEETLNNMLSARHADMDATYVATLMPNSLARKQSDESYPSKNIPARSDTPKLTSVKCNPSWHETGLKLVRPT